MGTIQRKQTGFTIIETIVVLAISSLLMITVLVGSTTAINQQRYQDSTASMVSLLQKEYTAITRVQNPDRGSNKYDCSSTDAAVTAGNASSPPRGASSCVLLGRAINISSGTDIVASDVVGYRDESVALPEGDIPALQTYQLSLFSQSTTTTEIPWNAAIVDASTSANRTLGILLLRSPASGSTVTFINSTGAITSTNAEGIVNSANIKKETMCLDSKELFTGPRNGIIIEAGASSPSGVSQQQAGSGC